MRLYFLLFLVCCFFSRALWAQEGEAAPRIAIWSSTQGVQADDLEAATSLEPERMERIKGWLEASGAQVTAFQTFEILDETRFRASDYDALFLPGDALPFWLIPIAKNFAQSGVLVSVNTRNAPWSLPLSPDVNGRWQKRPNAAPSTEMAELFGAKWRDLNDEDGAYFHHATPFFTPHFGPRREQALAEQFFPAPGVSFDPKTRVWPLIESLAGEEKTARTPQIFLMQREKAKALVVCNSFWSDEGEEAFADAPGLWWSLAIVCRNFRLGHFD